MHSFPAPTNNCTLLYSYTGAKQSSLFGVRPWPWWVSKQHDVDRRQRFVAGRSPCQQQQWSMSTYIYLYIYWLLPLYHFSYSYSLTQRVCLFRSSTVLYHYQRCRHVLYQHLCHHDVLSPSKCNRDTPATATTTTGTRFDMASGNWDMMQTISAERGPPIAIVKWNRGSASNTHPSSTCRTHTTATATATARQTPSTSSTPQQHGRADNGERGRSWYLQWSW